MRFLRLFSARISPPCLLSPPRRQIWNILLLCVKGQVKRRKPSWLVLLGYRWACVTNRCCPGLSPSLHLLLLLLMCVCLIVPARGSPLFPLTSWPLLPVRCVNAAFNQFYCLTHTHADTTDPIRPCSAEHASLRFHLTPSTTSISLTVKQAVNMDM